MSRRIKSLQLRLMVELAALFFVASCLAVGGLIYSASLTAGSLADRELGLRAEDLARYVSPEENRKPRLSLPPPLKQAYSAAAQQSLFAIRDKDGHIVEALSSSPAPAVNPYVLVPAPCLQRKARRTRRRSSYRTRGPRMRIGYRRTHWQDQWGYWGRGHCVPKWLEEGGGLPPG